MPALPQKMMAEGSGQNGLRSNQASLNHTNPRMLSPLGTVWLRQFCFSNSMFLCCLRGEHSVSISMLVLSMASQFAYQLLSTPSRSHTPLSTQKDSGACFPIHGKLDLLPVSEGSDHQPRTVSQVFVEVPEVCITNINGAVLLSLFPLVPELRQPGKSMGAGNL